MILVVDTETSGLSPETDRVCEVAGVWVNPLLGTVTGSFHSLVNPGRVIPHEASAIHHIVDKDVENAPTLRKVFSKVELKNIQAYCAHNAAFDRQFLTELAEKPWICTWKCANAVWPEAPSYSNQVLRYYLDIQVPVAEGRGAFPHSALYDALTTAEILNQLLKHKTVEEMVQISSQPVLLRTMNFGKHRGLPFSEVPADYLRWLSRQTDLDEDLRHTLKHHLA